METYGLEKYGITGIKEIVYNIFPALGMQHFKFRHDIAVHNIALFGKCLIDALCTHTQFCRHIFNAKYGKLQFTGIFDFFICHHTQVLSFIFYPKIFFYFTLTFFLQRI